MFGCSASSFRLRTAVLVLCGAFNALHAINAQDEAGVAEFIKSHPHLHGYVTPMPPYPRGLAAAHVGGEMILGITYAAEGNVADVVLVKSSGTRNLDDSTMRYVKRNWRSTMGKRSKRLQTFDFRQGQQGETFLRRSASFPLTPTPHRLVCLRFFGKNGERDSG